MHDQGNLEGNRAAAGCVGVRSWYRHVGVARTHQPWWAGPVFISSFFSAEICPKVKAFGRRIALKTHKVGQGISENSIWQLWDFCNFWLGAGVRRQGV